MHLPALPTSCMQHEHAMRRFCQAQRLVAPSCRLKMHPYVTMRLASMPALLVVCSPLGRFLAGLGHSAMTMAGVAQPPAMTTCLDQPSRMYYAVYQPPCMQTTVLSLSTTTWRAVAHLEADLCSRHLLLELRHRLMAPLIAAGDANHLKAQSGRYISSNACNQGLISSRTGTSNLFKPA